MLPNMSGPRPSPGRRRPPANNVPYTNVSSVELIEKPPRANDICATQPHPPAKSTIRGHDQHRLRTLSGEGDDGIVSGTGGVNHFNPIDCTLTYSGTGRAFQDHRDRFGQSAGNRGGAYPGDELSGRSRAVSPPPIGTGTDDVGGVNHEHLAASRPPRGSVWLPPAGV